MKNQKPRSHYQSCNVTYVHFGSQTAEMLEANGIDTRTISHKMMKDAEETINKVINKHGSLNPTHLEPIIKFLELKWPPSDIVTLLPYP